MTPAARLSAAIELIDTIDTQRVPAAKALKEWGTAHRYAGSGDRAAISGLIWDVLRRRASSAWLMDADTPRARLLGMLKLERGLNAEAIAALCDGGRFAPEPLDDAERAALTSRSLDDAPAHIAGDYPEWLDPYLAPIFGDDRVAEATAMASRAPLDLRVNTLKAKREKVLPSARSSRRAADAVVADRPAHRTRRRRAQSRHPCRGGLHQGRGRSPGRGLATRGAVVGGKARRAGDRSLRRRRRQDAGAGRDDAGQGPADRDRPRQAPARADPRAAVARRRPQRRRAHAERRRRPARRYQGIRRSRADRRALHGHRHLAAQPRCQMADAPGRARSAVEGPDRSA